MHEFEDEITARLLEPFFCVACKEQYPNYLRSKKESDTCSYCAGERINPCKDCKGEDCVCCEHYDTIKTYSQRRWF
ncbi:MAG: hypothetical protein ACFFAH_03295 [Promethearchaeota archaeon]